jgi:hypothetical protein
VNKGGHNCHLLFLTRCVFSALTPDMCMQLGFLQPGHSQVAQPCTAQGGFQLHQLCRSRRHPRPLT